MNSGSCSQMSSSCNCPIVSEIVTRDTRQHSQKGLRALTRSSFLVSRTSLSVSLLLLGGRTSEHENKHLPPLPDARCTPTRSASAKSEPEMAARLVRKRSVAMIWKYGTLCKRSIIEERILIVIKCLKSLHISTLCISYYFM